MVCGRESAGIVGVRREGGTHSVHQELQAEWESRWCVAGRVGGADGGERNTKMWGHMRKDRSHVGLRDQAETQRARVRDVINWPFSKSCF